MADEAKAVDGREIPLGIKGLSSAEMFLKPFQKTV